MVLGFLIFFVLASVADCIHANHKLQATINPPWRH